MKPYNATEIKWCESPDFDIEAIDLHRLIATYQDWHDKVSVENCLGTQIVITRSDGYNYSDLEDVSCVYKSIARIEKDDFLICLKAALLRMCQYYLEIDGEMYGVLGHCDEENEGEA